MFVWYILIFYFLLFLLILFIPYGKWNYSFGYSDFLNFSFSYSFENCLFLLVLLLVSFMIFVYGSFYMQGVFRLVYFFLILFSFVMSMGGLIIFINSVLLTLICWDFLGISSFFLILFYNNVSSRCGSMSTVFTNRIGDFCIFLFFNGLILFSVGSLSYQFFGSLVGVLLFISAFIKGGQYPFGSWLPKAMAAPTPVSCLVHSSTLVTAGVMLMSCYSYVSLSSEALFFIFVVGFFTMFFASCCALIEEDAKKIVALSTMSQMGFCFLAMGSGFHYISYIHMISHSFFKSLLFMQMGYLIFMNLGQQDYRGYSYSGVASSVLVQLQIFLSAVCLCGLLFTSGACSKEYFMARFYYDSYGLFLVLLYFFGIFLTFCYCYRMLYLFYVGFSSFDYAGMSSKLFYWSGFFLVLFSVVFTFWWILNLLSLSFVFNRLEYLVVFVYLFLIFCLMNYFFKYSVLELKSKFFMDMYARYIYKIFPDFNVLEWFVMGVNYSFFGGARLFSFFLFSLFRGVYHWSIFVLFGFLLFYVFF